MTTPAGKNGFWMIPVSLLLIGLAGCPGGDTPQGPGSEEDNLPPEARATTSHPGARPGETVIISAAESSDPENDPLTFRWVQTAGPSVELANADAAETSFVAPEAPSGTVLTFTVTVSDGPNSSDASVSVTILPADSSANRPPIANAGPDQTVEAGSTVILDGTGSWDPDGSALTYAWSTEAAVSLIGADAATASFVAPTPTEDTVLEFTLTVSDGELVASDTVRIVVRAVLPAQVSILSFIPADANMAMGAKHLKALVDAARALPGVGGSLDQLDHIFNQPVFDGQWAFALRTSDLMSALFAQASLQDVIAAINEWQPGCTIQNLDNGLTEIIRNGYPMLYIGTLADGEFLVAASEAAHVLEIQSQTHSLLEKLSPAWIETYNQRQFLFYSDSEVPLPLGIIPLPLVTTGTPSDPSATLPDAEAVCLTGTITDVLNVTLWVRFTPGTPSATKLAGRQMTADNLLVGLPDERLIVAMGVHGNDNPARIHQLVPQLQASTSGGVTARTESAVAAIDALTRQSASMVSQLDGTTGCFGFAEIVQTTAGGASAYLNHLEVLADELKIGAVAMGASDSVVSLTQDFTELAGRTVYQLIIDLAAFPNYAAPSSEPILSALLGNGEIIIRFVAVNSDAVVVSLGGGAARLAAIVENV
ncbi:MAG TPA: PKD domain-containing protein, partial [Phycisphaerae bacterium]|nr:PKD domain-containing protein [Phycisphaerae bacterium]HOL25377.1 PKD domain-containing protein [Phycisphaerae bacterium]HQA46571.1 PKD domain-containing protein [Phycisphaerae bacterium]